MKTASEIIGILVRCILRTTYTFEAIELASAELCRASIASREESLTSASPVGILR